MSGRATALGAALGLAIALAVSGPMLRAIAALGEARGERARVAAMLALPPAAPGPGDARRTPAADAAAAARGAAARLRREGSARGVLIERIATAGSPAPRIAAITVAASGSERAVIAFADAVERGDPLLRWSRWRLRAAGDGAVRIEGEVIVPWR